MIEEIKSVGSIVGLITGLAFFYDRFAKGRPVASLTIADRNTRKLACIRISNVSPYDIAVFGAMVQPGVYFLTETIDTRDLIDGAAGRTPYFMLKPGESKELVIAPRFQNGVALEIQEQRVRFSIRWRRGNATWLPQIPVWVWTSTGTIRRYGLEKPNFPS